MESVQSFAKQVNRKRLTSGSSFSFQILHFQMIKVLQLGKPVDVLINNAGIMFGPRKETSEVSISS